MPSHSLISLSASTNVRRLTWHQRSIISPVSPASAKSAHVPALAPWMQTLSECPGSPEVLPTHHSRPLRTPCGRRYSATSNAFPSNARFNWIISVTTSPGRRDDYPNRPALVLRRRECALGIPVGTPPSRLVEACTALPRNRRHAG